MHPPKTIESVDSDNLATSLQIAIIQILKAYIKVDKTVVDDIDYECTCEVMHEPFPNLLR